MRRNKAEALVETLRVGSRQAARELDQPASSRPGARDRLQYQSLAELRLELF